MKAKFALVLSFLVLSSTVNANDFAFTIGTGYPFASVIEGSVASSDQQQRYYINGKFGSFLGGPFAVGYSIGFEKIISDDGKSAIGLVAGAIGQEKTETCDDKNDVDKAFCPLATIWEDNVINGLGATYSYNFNGLNKSGGRIQFIAGYGRGTETHDNQFSGSVVISYQF